MHDLCRLETFFFVGQQSLLSVWPAGEVNILPDTRTLIALSSFEMRSCCP